MSDGLRWLHYLAFGIAFIGAQACATEEPPPPPLTHASGPVRAGQASTDGSDDDGSDGSDVESPDPGQDETQALESQPGTPLDPTECSVTYAKDILPKIRDQWRCGAGGCHSAPLATGATTVFDTANADTTFALLTTTVHSGKKLVDTSSALPSDSAIYCLMQGTCGERMPRQGVDPLDLALVETWLECKAPRGTAP